MGGNTRKIQKTSFVNRWFELNVKKLLEMLEFIQPSRISTGPIFPHFFEVSPWQGPWQRGQADGKITWNVVNW
jgi:hypothetical protein